MCRDDSNWQRHAVTREAGLVKKHRINIGKGSRFGLEGFIFRDKFPISYFAKKKKKYNVINGPSFWKPEYAATMEPLKCTFVQIKTIPIQELEALDYILFILEIDIISYFALWNISSFQRVQSELICSPHSPQGLRGTAFLCPASRSPAPYPTPPPQPQPRSLPFSPSLLSLLSSIRSFLATKW